MICSGTQSTDKRL